MNGGALSGMQFKQYFENICSDWQQQQQSYTPLLMERRGKVTEGEWEGKGREKKGRERERVGKREEEEEGKRRKWEGKEGEENEAMMEFRGLNY